MPFTPTVAGIGEQPTLGFFAPITAIGLIWVPEVDGEGNILVDQEGNELGSYQSP